MNASPKTATKMLSANGKVVAVTMNVSGSYAGSEPGNYNVTATIQNDKSVLFKLTTDAGIANARVSGTLVYI